MLTCKRQANLIASKTSSNVIKKSPIYILNKRNINTAYTHTQTKINICKDVRLFSLFVQSNYEYMIEFKWLTKRFFCCCCFFIYTHIDIN